jgi:LCP family protein required for cell wall assembly
MATTPPQGESDHSAANDESPGQKWTGRASVAPPVTAAASAPVVASRPVSPQSTYPPPAPVYSGKKKLRPRWGRIFLVGTLALLLVAGLGAVASYLWISNVNAGLRRTDPFEQIENRPPKVSQGALNVLLLGSDSRDPDAPANQPGVARTDTIVLMHIPASHDKAFLISFPRDLYVYIPQSKTSEFGDTTNKINAAYGWGGMPLMVETIERYTQVRIDHVVLIDFAGFTQVVDALGGVDMKIDKTITSEHKPHRTFKKGMNHLNGAEALDYIRQRKRVGSDFNRIKNQQTVLKALLDKAVSAGTLSNPFKFRAFVTSTAKAVTVDQDFSLLDLGWLFRSLRSSDLVFRTSPCSGTDFRANAGDVVLPNEEKAKSLYQAVVNDTVADWVAKNPPPTSGGC